MNEEQFIAKILEIRSKDFLQELSNIKQKGQIAFKSKNWIWDSLIISATTLGKVLDDQSISRIRANLFWNTIKQYDDKNLTKIMSQSFEENGVRFYNRKTEWMVKNRNIIKDYGGPVSFKKLWINENLEDALTLLRRFHGISHKYSRNIGMDAGDERFNNSAAIDVRILNIISSISSTNLPSNINNERKYLEYEDYLRGLAGKLGISLWELDRTIFQKYNMLKETKCNH